MCASGLRREHDMLETGEFGSNSWSNKFVCILVWGNKFVVYCVQVVANPEIIVGPLPWRPNSRQPLDNDPWAQQVWCDTRSHFRGNTHSLHTAFFLLPEARANFLRS